MMLFVNRVTVKKEVIVPSPSKSEAILHSTSLLLRVE